MIKYLAVIFDEELKWSNHIDYVCDIEFDIEIDGAASATNLEIMQKGWWNWSWNSTWELLHIIFC